MGDQNPSHPERGKFCFLWPNKYCSKITIPSVCKAIDASNSNEKFKLPCALTIKFGRSSIWRQQ
jgi:hypothetical protein